ncbi:MAG: tripartite tricarboxylate transporter substrate-binding protein [Pseudomonadota bacterium]
MALTRLATLSVALGVLAIPVSAQSNEGTPLTIDQAIAIALEVQPGTVAEAEPDQFEGRPVIDIEIVNEAGEEIEFKVDVQTGEILNQWTDDDLTDDPGEVGAPVIEDATFLIPGHEGGGWDSAARAIGEALTGAGIIETIGYENLDGNNGGAGLAAMLSDAAGSQDRLMVNSTQIVIRSLNGTYENTYADLRPVAAPVGDFIAFIVHPESEIQSMDDLWKESVSSGADFALGGGSEPGGIDHLVSAMAFKAAGVDPSFQYVQFESPAPAFQALAAGDVVAIATDFNRARELSEQNMVRIVGVTAGEKEVLPGGLMSLRDQGIDMDFVTWSGFFASPGMETAQIAVLETAFEDLYQSAAWADLIAKNNWHTLGYDEEAFDDLLNRQDAAIRDILQSVPMN